MYKGESLDIMHAQKYSYNDNSKRRQIHMKNMLKLKYGKLYYIMHSVMGGTEKTV